MNSALEQTGFLFEMDFDDLEEETAEPVAEETAEPVATLEDGSFTGFGALLGNEEEQESFAPPQFAAVDPIAVSEVEDAEATADDLERDVEEGDVEEGDSEDSSTEESLDGEPVGEPEETAASEQDSAGVLAPIN